jgi:hypothetical protein
VPTLVTCRIPELRARREARSLSHLVSHVHCVIRMVVMSVQPWAQQRAEVCERVSVRDSREDR